MRSLGPMLLCVALAVAAGTCGLETAEDCAEDEVYAAPGCGEPAEGAELVSAGCYHRCEDGDLECPEGTACVRAYIDPCAMAACRACGGETRLCTP